MRSRNAPMIPLVTLSLIVSFSLAGAQSPAPTPTVVAPAAAPLTPEEMAEKISPEEARKLPQKLKIKPPPYIFKKDGTPYKPPVISPKLRRKTDMLRARGVDLQVHRAKFAITPPLNGALGDWVSFMHAVIHRK